MSSAGEAGTRISFAPGTQVHTEQGLVAVENLRVGMRVLARAAEGGEPAYRTVIHTLAQLDHSVYAVRINGASNGIPVTVFATSPHLLPVAGQAENVRHATITAIGLVLRTRNPLIGRALDRQTGSAMLVDLARSQPRPLDTAGVPEVEPSVLREPFLTPVYHFDLGEGYPFCCVGEPAVWVHHAECPTGATAENTRIASQCFDGDTLVRVEPVVLRLDTESYATRPVRKIDQIAVGDEVLARCEATGEIAYKSVTRVFTGIASTSFITYSHANGKKEGFFVTPDHFFRVEGKGWVKAAELLPDDEFLTFNGEKAVCVSVKFDVYSPLVFNLEVEDFHTYFVGHEGLWVRGMNHA